MSQPGRISLHFDSLPHISKQPQQLQIINTWGLAILHMKVVTKTVQSQIQNHDRYYLLSACYILNYSNHFLLLSWQTGMKICTFDKWENWDPGVCLIIIFISPSTFICLRMNFSLSLLSQKYFSPFSLNMGKAPKFHDNSSLVSFPHSPSSHTFWSITRQI